MILSMTGYGKFQTDINGKLVLVEIRSLNSRFFDLSLRIPQALKTKELELRQHLTKALKRGKVELTVQIGNGAEESKTPINKILFKQYHDELKVLSDEYGLDDEDMLSTILKMPNVLEAPETEIDESFIELVINAINQAIIPFIQFREKEGNELAIDLNKRVNLIVENLKEVELIQPERTTQIKQRIKDHLKEYLTDSQTEENRLEQEMVFYIEKLDITEEIVRLTSHCNYFIEVINGNDSNGKKLNFISQEMGREINTIGSKASHAEMQKFVVQMKDELEKIKEQLNNVL